MVSCQLLRINLGNSIGVAFHHWVAWMFNDSSLDLVLHFSRNMSLIIKLMTPIDSDLRQITVLIMSMTDTDRRA